MPTSDVNSVFGPLDFLGVKVGLHECNLPVFPG